MRAELQGLMGRLESRRAALNLLNHELDCCLQGIARPAEEAGAAPAEGSARGSSKSSSGDGGRQSHGNAASSPVAMRSLHRKEAAEAARATYQASLARSSGGARALWALNEGAASKTRLQDDHSLATALTSRGGTGVAEAGLHTDDLFEESSEGEGSSAREGSGTGGQELPLDSDDSSSASSERPVDVSSMRNRIEPYTLLSHGWRAPYAAQLHAKDPVSVPDWMTECAPLCALCLQCTAMASRLPMSLEILRAGGVMHCAHFRC